MQKRPSPSLCPLRVAANKKIKWCRRTQSRRRRAQARGSPDGCSRPTQTCARESGGSRAFQLLDFVVQQLILLQQRVLPLARLRTRLAVLQLRFQLARLRLERLHRSAQPPIFATQWGLRATLLCEPAQAEGRYPLTTVGLARPVGLHRRDAYTVGSWRRLARATGRTVSCDSLRTSCSRSRCISSESWLPPKRSSSSSSSAIRRRDSAARVASFHFVSSADDTAVLCTKQRNTVRSYSLPRVPALSDPVEEPI